MMRGSALPGPQSNRGQISITVSHFTHTTLSTHYLDIIYTIYLHNIYTLQVRYELSLGLPTDNLPREQWDTWDPTLISEVSLGAFSNFYMMCKSSFVTHTLCIYCFSLYHFLGVGSINLIIHCSLSSHPISLLSHDE